MNNHKPSLRNYFIGYTFLWLLWMVLHIIILTNNGFSILTAASDSIISNTLLYFICLIITNILRIYQPGKSSSKYLLFWCLILGVIWLVLVSYITPLLISNDVAFDDLFQATLLLRFVLALFLIGGSILMMWVWQNAMNQKEENIRHYQAIQMAKDAELASLRQQLQPHFLFNSLNSISALAGSKPQEARQMIQQLSDFLRGTLKKEDAKFTSLTEELAHLKLYLDIEKVRFGYRLNTTFDINEACNVMLLPPLLLQPIVENAIKFGLYDTIGAVTISIKAESVNNELVIEVMNPFDNESNVKTKGVGFGLSSLQRRLYLIYNRQDLLKTRSENKQFITTLTIPQLA